MSLSKPPNNVDIHGLAISAEPGRSDDVVSYASRLNVDDVPSVERRARALIDTARGYVQRGEDEVAILVLIAEQASADEVRHSGAFRQVIRPTCVHEFWPRSSAAGLAARVGIPDGEIAAGRADDEQVVV
jgi:hypothetical protein